MNRTPIVLHVDMDAFYAAIEMRDDPGLRGLPVIVGGSSRRGVVSTASYEARKFGVHSAMPGFEARRRCPDGIFLSPRISHYAAVSRQLMELFERYSPTVEPLSLDEAFLEMTGAERIFGTPREMAERIANDIRAELGLTASVGVSTTKYVAKVASDYEKPDGITVVEPGTEKEFLAPLPIRRIWGVGPKASSTLERLGLKTIGEVAATPREVLVAKMGGFGAHVWHLANAIDMRRVSSKRTRKSIGSERTLAVDIVDREVVRGHLLPLADEVARGLRKGGWRAHGVRLKLKTNEFRLMTRDRHVAEAVCDAESILAALDALLAVARVDVPLRLVGVAAYDLVKDGTPRQVSLFDAESTGRRERLEATMDEVSEKFGRGGLVRGSSLDKA
jgi:DNA polymerase-4